MPNPGDKLTDFITTSWYDEVTANSRKVKTGPRPINEEEQWSYIIVKNHSNEGKRKWDAVALGTPALDYEADLGVSHKEIIFNTAALNGDDPDNIAILQEPLPGYIGASAKALLVGRSWLFLSEPKTTLDFIRVGDNDTLEYDTSGRIEVIRDFQYSVGSSTTSISLSLGPASQAVPIISIGPSVQVSGGYIALVLIGSLGGGRGGIIDIRVNGYDFEYTFDGEVWHKWYEGAPCTS